MKLLEKDQKIRKMAEHHVDSEQLRAIVTLILLEKGEFLTKKAQTMGSLVIKKIVKNHLPLPWEPDFYAYNEETNTVDKSYFTRLVAEAIKGKRLSILLKLYPEKQYNSRELSEMLEIPRPQIGFYLADLKHNNIVDSEFRIIEEPTDDKKGLAGAFYFLTDNGKNIVKYLKENIKPILEKID